MLNANEGWMIGNKAILYYKDRNWEIFNIPRLLAFSSILMLNENEGWAVGPGILHYTNK
jgi:photosystem II stability/assembly factor-like uncharacterized protein